MKLTNTLLLFFFALYLHAQERTQYNELTIPQKNGKRIYGVISGPATQGKHGIAIISHGFNGTHHFGKDYFQTLNDLG